VSVFDRMDERGHEQVSFWSDPEVGYRGIIAIHDTTLGPALGGTRFWSYASEAEALADVLLLARAMTYKAAVAGLNVGGGKSVIIGDNRIRDRELLLRAHGRAVNAVGGRYIAAEDVGTSAGDMELIRMETKFVTGAYVGAGDPSPLTALGTLQGMKAAAAETWGETSLRGKHVAVQGLGNVGSNLCRLLHAEGALLTVADIDVQRVERAVERFEAEAVAPDEIHAVEADIFAPCALGAVINDETLPDLKVAIVAGAANNQLAEPHHGAELRERSILYAPDYVGNAGGLIVLYGELKGWDAERSRRKVEGIFETMRVVFERARTGDTTPEAAADRIAERRIERIRDLHHRWP
jgi:leucine dehydrogenase